MEALGGGRSLSRVVSKHGLDQVDGLVACALNDFLERQTFVVGEFETDAVGKFEACWPVDL